MLIAGDIGGTRTDLAVYAKESGHLMARLPVHLITTQAAADRSRDVRTRKHERSIV